MWKNKPQEISYRYINSRAENGLTALHLAAFSGSLSCMQLLLAAGADVMMETIDQGMSSIINMPAGSTVLHAAVESHQVSIVQAVLLVSPFAGGVKIAYILLFYGAKQLWADLSTCHVTSGYRYCYVLQLACP